MNTKGKAQTRSTTPTTTTNLKQILLKYFQKNFLMGWGDEREGEGEFENALEPALSENDDDDKK